MNQKLNTQMQQNVHGVKIYNSAILKMFENIMKFVFKLPLVNCNMEF
jgi:hypothetical protein